MSDRQTDRRSDAQRQLNDSIYRASIASRGKNLYPSKNKGRRAPGSPPPVSAHGADLMPGLLISNIDVDVDIIDDTFDVSISISTILSYKSIDHGMGDTLLAFLSTLHRYFSTDMQNDAHNFLSFTAFVRVQRSVEILDERRITCNKI